MKSIVRGKCYVVGDDIDTDQIIPAQYLTYNPAIPEERKMFGKFALIGLPEAARGLPKGEIPFVREGADRSDYKMIIAGRNFGCGSSREHAAIAIQEAGIEAVVAEFYSRIFFRNCVNGGYSVPFETPERLCDQFDTGDEAELDVAKNTLKNLTQNKTYSLKPLGAILPIIEAGNVFEYAKRVGMIPSPVCEERAGERGGYVQRVLQFFRKKESTIKNRGQTGDGMISKPAPSHPHSEPEKQVED